MRQFIECVDYLFAAMHYLFFIYFFIKPGNMTLTWTLGTAELCREVL